MAALAWRAQPPLYRSRLATKLRASSARRKFRRPGSRKSPTRRRVRREARQVAIGDRPPLTACLSCHPTFVSHRGARSQRAASALLPTPGLEGAANAISGLPQDTASQYRAETNMRTISRPALSPHPESARPLDPAFSALSKSEERRVGKEGR